MSQQPSPRVEALDDLISVPRSISRRYLRSQLSLRRHDRRAVALGHRHTALGLLMAAEQLDELVDAAARPCASAGERLALASLWATLYRVGNGGPDRGTPNWNPGIAHARHARDVRRWAGGRPAVDIAALLRQARRRAAAEFLAARGGPSGTRKSAVCPI